MATTSLAQAVRNAVEAERSAERFYRQLAQNTQDPGARDFLIDMANQEVDHAKAFENLGARLEAGELPFAASFNVEVIETAPEWADAANLTYEQALAIALENEQRAELYYDALADTTEGDVADFFSRIAAVEAQHVQVLQEKLGRGSQ